MITTIEVCRQTARRLPTIVHPPANLASPGIRRPPWAAVLAIVVAIGLVLAGGSPAGADPDGEIEDLLAEKRGLEEELIALSLLSFQQHWPAYVLQQVSAALPDATRIEELTIAGGEVTLAGRTEATDRVAQLASRLAAEPLLAIDVRRTSARNGSFRFTMALRPAFPTAEPGEGSALAGLRFESDEEVLALRRALAHDRLRKSAMRDRFTPPETVPSVLRAIRFSAQAAELELLRMSPAPRRCRGIYAEFPVVIAAQGSYAQIKRYVTSLAELPFAVRVDDLTLEPAAGGPPSLAAALTVSLITRSDCDSGPQDRPGIEPVHAMEAQLEDAVEIMRQVLTVGDRPVDK